MGIIETLIVIAICLLGLAVAAFAAGPCVLQWFFETLEEWQEIIESARDEK